MELESIGNKKYNSQETVELHKLWELSGAFQNMNSH